MTDNTSKELTMSNIRNKRKNDRVQCLKSTFILLKGKLFRISDISNEGIGIFLEEDEPFFYIGERLKKIPLPLQNGTVDFNGVVSHITKNTTNNVCGIRFLFSGNEFNEFMQFKKERLLPPL